jgi:hypothetical protein
VEVHYPGERHTKDKPNLRQEINASIERNNMGVLLLKAGLLSESLETLEAAAQLMRTISQSLKPFFDKRDRYGTACNDSLSKPADCCKIHGHYNVSQRCNENMQLDLWVGKQRRRYKLHLEGKEPSDHLPSVYYDTRYRIRILRSLPADPPVEFKACVRRAA